MILTAPYERLSVRTYTAPFDEITIIEAIKREIYGRKNGICKGRGGSMHISDFDKGMLGSFGIVAAGPPVAIGEALLEILNKGKKN